MDEELVEFVSEVISGMMKKAISLEEPALADYESWLETATKLALKNEDKIKTGVADLIKTMTTPSSLFYVGFIHGYAHRGSASLTNQDQDSDGQL